MDSPALIIISVMLLAAAGYCIFLLIRFSQKLGGMKGEKVTEELEDMDKLRAELIATNRKLREEIAKLKKQLDEKEKQG
ncbi:MAG: hypothetical protein HZC17_01290 [Candidatus Omnitrophica bacterium]|nr:hypothetical protein [Candidatus Omnitrophota bacterium]